MEEIIFNIVIFLVETLYFSIPINKILKNENLKSKTLVYFKILIIDIISTTIFDKSIFRYLFSFIIMYLAIFDFKISNKIYDFFIIPILFFIKAILEYLVYVLIFNLVSYIIFVIILELISILFIIYFSKIFVNIYNRLEKSWNGKKQFYCRYTMLIVFVSFIIFLIYNLIKIKEVL